MTVESLKEVRMRRYLTGHKFDHFSPQKQAERKFLSSLMASECTGALYKNHTRTLEDLKNPPFMYS
jgi:hypothetical protein